MSSKERPLPIAVIGAGFSGTMAAIQLLAHLPPERPVLLCERADTFARGMAYHTGNAAHLLNLRTANMSAFPDRPGHFEDWLDRLDPASLAGNVRATPAGAFAARGLYGRYLGELLTRAVTAGGVPRLHLVNDAIVDLEPAAHGFVLRTEGGQGHRVAGAVLAMGNLAARSGPDSRYRVDPWRPEAVGRLRPDLPVLIVGTGLTMVDAVASLRSHGFSGPITALSRRGLLPNPHAPSQPWPLPALGPPGTTLPSLTALTLTALLALVRAEIARAARQGVDWRGVLDALRPVTNDLWRGLPPAEQARFLRHLRPFWDVHRHRTAPPADETIRTEIARGSLSVQAGRLVSIADAEGHAVVTWRPRGGGEDRGLAVQCILDATGIGRVCETRDGLLLRLIARGLVRPGPFGLGLDAGPDYRVQGARRSPVLWTLGPLLRGVLWECTAVPDIRNEAAELAAVIAHALDPAAAA